MRNDTYWIDMSCYLSLGSLEIKLIFFYMSLDIRRIMIIITYNKTTER